MANGDFAQLFQTAVERDGDEYLDARDAILALGDEVRPQIALKLDAADWRERLVAQILEGWLDHGVLFEEAGDKVKGFSDTDENAKPLGGTHSPQHRVEELATLGQEIVPRLLEMLLKSMEYENTGDVQTIIQTLEVVPDERSVLPMMDVVANRQLEPAQVFALGVLGKLRDQRAFDTIESAFTNLQNSAGIRSAAAVALGMFGDRRITNRLLAVLRDPTEDQSVRRFAARGLASLGDPSGVDAMAGMLRTEESPEMALTLVQSLRRLGGSTAIAALEETGRSHTDENIRRAAESARRTLA